MKSIVILTALSVIGFGAFAQMQIDKKIQLTGTGSNAKIEGIQDVSNADDAASKMYVDTTIANSLGGPCNVPNQPGAISGPVAVTPNEQGVQFTVNGYIGPFAYEWTVPSGATIVSGQGSTTVTVDFGTTSGNVEVKGANHCGASTASTLAVSVSVPKYVFVSSTELESNQSPAQRDAACQTDAGSAGLGGTYKAWVSNGGSNNVPATTGKLYRRVDLAVVANDWADLTDGTLAVAINRTAANGVITDTVFTGLSSNGSVAGNTCTDWTTTSNAVSGAFGLTSATNGSWTSDGNKQCAGAPTPTFLGYVGNYSYKDQICQNCWGGSYTNGTQTGNFTNVPYTVACDIIPVWNSVTVARCYDDVITQTSYRHYCVEQ